MLALFIAGSYSELVQNIENMGYHFASQFASAEKTRSRVVLLAIDKSTTERMGPLPWPRTQLAKIVNRLRREGAKSVILLPDLSRPQTSSVRDQISVDTVYLQDNKLKRNLFKILARIDTDRILVEALRRSKRVILPTWYYDTPISQQVPNALHQYLINDDRAKHKNWLSFFSTLNSYTTYHGLQLKPPLSLFTKYALGVGVIHTPNPKVRTRSMPLIFQLEGKFLPSVALIAYARQWRIKPEKIKIIGPGLIKVGHRLINTGPYFRYFPLMRDSNNKPLLKTIPLVSVIDNKHKLRLRGKTVIVGVTNPSYARFMLNASGLAIPLAQWQASTIQALLTGQSIKVPEPFYLLQRSLILLFGLYLLLIPRQFYRWAGYLASVVIGIIILNVGQVIILVQHLWLPSIVPVLFLLITHGFIALSWQRTRHTEQLQRETSKVRQELGSYYQIQGNLPQAFDQFAECIDDGNLAKTLYNLGLDFERRRMFDKALEVYEHIKQLGTFYKDSETRIERLLDVTHNFPSSGSVNSAATQLMIADDKVEKPMLGRYQLEREIGRGAMGMVYLGKDPKIARQVAIKTLALGDEFEGKALEESENRFFREAEAIGRLNHPNIVTIYDVGEDQGVAYIAMDFVAGASLDKHMLEDELLEQKTVIEIAIQVADALTYAHKQKVIHRDIKPANIIYHDESHALKVTDFGIAALTDDSKTRTGTILGSPSYMSPEQISGKKVSGKSDQFSLGVTMYQLLSGRLPFDGDSMANLMYQITNQTHRPLRKIRRGTPPCISRVINKALQKSPENRFQDCKAMADALRKCYEQI
ncbi:Serine/threonine protein kinase PrkC, regulator of stationary phase [hydrothermal vent metagenome]|uniref:Serine/threonine protein kinase PrkC, regulator of stationary phase n=1 Tax=hydrothermal vent metagenome TaxID=652676 RepID=A0A3B0Y8Y0_9ZZZZ